MKGVEDEVVGAVIAADKDIFTISADGNAKRNKADAYRIQGRNGMGVRNFKKGFEVVALVAADDNDELVGVSEQGITIKTKASQITSKKPRQDRASSSRDWRRATASHPSTFFPVIRKTKRKNKYKSFDEIKRQ